MSIRAKAVDDLEHRPWRYYHLDREVLEKMLDQQADLLTGNVASERELGK